MNRVKGLQERESAHSGKSQDAPRHGSESTKGPRVRGQDKDFTVQLQSMKKLR